MFKKSKSFASELLPKSFKGEKCKISLKLVRTRIMLTKNKKGIQVKQMRRDIATLLAAGQDQTALIRVEHVIREEKNLSAYELIDIYCELIIAQMPIIESRRNCPIDLKEAISSVIFASSRCADIPEIIDVRKQFVAKYGKEFITAALEVRPECGVSSMLVEKLSASAPDSGTKMKALSSIAEEFNIKWDTKSFEDQNQMPTVDSMAGPKTFASASQMPIKSLNANYSHTSSRMNEQIERMSRNDIVSKTPGFKDSASSINTTSVPSTPSNTKVTENGGSRPSWEEVNSAHQTESASLNQQNWNMGFKDATSAAQAAAESAERASVAARAAAELSRRESASYNEIKQNIKESVPMQFDEIKLLPEWLLEAEDRNTGELSQARSGKGGRRTCGNMNVIRSFSYSPYSYEETSNDDLLEANKKNEGRPYGYTTFDDADGRSSDGGDVIKDIMRKGEMKSTNSHHNRMFSDYVEFTSSDRYRKSSVSDEISGSPSPTEISSGNSDISQRFFRMRKEKSQLSGLSGVSSLEAEANNTFRMYPSLLDINFPDMSNDSSTVEKDGLSLGRLTGGFRNKGFPDPPYLRDPLPDASVPLKPVHTRAVKECVPSQEKSFASSEASYQGRYDEESNLHGCRSNANASGVFLEFDKFKGLDSHHSVGRRVHVADSSPTLDVEEQTVSHQNKASSNSENLAYDSYSLKSMARDSNLYGSRSYGRSKSALLPPKENINISLSIERNVSISETAFASREVSNEQRQTVRANRESRLRVPLDYFAQDGVKAEPQYPLGFRNDRCANLSRNRDLPSATDQRGSVFRFNARSRASAEMESEFSGGSLSSETPNTENRSMHLERKDSSRSSQQNISLERSSMTTSHADSLSRRDNPDKFQVNSESPKLPSHEGSFKSVSHVHPKLPDYDTIVAHFQSLRANQR